MTMRQLSDVTEIFYIMIVIINPCTLIGRTDAEAEAPILWPSDANSQLIGKYPEAGKD